MHNKLVSAYVKENISNGFFHSLPQRNQADNCSYSNEYANHGEPASQFPVKQIVYSDFKIVLYHFPLRASTGCNEAACFAGMTPNTAPSKNENISAPKNNE